MILSYGRIVTKRVICFRVTHSNYSEVSNDRWSENPLLSPPIKYIFLSQYHKAVFHLPGKGQIVLPLRINPVLLKMAVDYFQIDIRHLQQSMEHPLHYQIALLSRKSFS